MDENLHLMSSKQLNTVSVQDLDSGPMSPFTDLQLIQLLNPNDELGKSRFLGPVGVQDLDWNHILYKLH